MLVPGACIPIVVSRETMSFSDHDCNIEPLWRQSAKNIVPPYPIFGPPCHMINGRDWEITITSGREKSASRDLRPSGAHFCHYRFPDLIIWIIRNGFITQHNSIRWQLHWLEVKGWTTRVNPIHIWGSKTLWEKVCRRSISLVFSWDIYPGRLGEVPLMKIGEWFCLSDLVSCHLLITCLLVDTEKCTF